MSSWWTPGRIVTGIAGIATVVAALAAATGTQRAQVLGLTQHGALVTAQDAGGDDAVALVAVAPGTPGQVLTVSDAGLPHWAAGGGGGGGGGGPTYGSGTYAARPSTCAGGDRYQVTSGARTGSTYLCTATDTWSLDAILPPTSVTPLAWWDTERLEPHVGQTLTLWRAESGEETLYAATATSVQPSVLAAASAWGGLPAASWASGAGALLSQSTGPLWAQPRTFVVIISAVDSGGTRAIGGWGRSAGSTQSFAMRCAGSTGFSFYGIDPGGTGAIPTTSTPAVLVGTYTGSHYALRQATLAASPSWSYSLASTAAALTTYPGGLLIGAHPWNTSNTETPYIGRIHWIGIYATALSEGESDALATALYARLQ